MGSVTEYIKSVCIQPTSQYPQQARYRHHGELIGGVVTDDLQTAVLWTSNKSGFSLQKVEGDRRDTETVVLAPCHCEDREHVHDAGDTEQCENAGTKEVDH